MCAVFVPVGRECLVLKMARVFQVHSIAVTLGASYFQRLVTTECGANWTPHESLWSDFLEDVSKSGVARFKTVNNKFCAKYDTGDDAWSIILYVACVNMAVKFSHYPDNPPKRFGGYSLNNMVSYIFRNMLKMNGTRVREVVLTQFQLKPHPTQAALSVNMIFFFDVWLLRKLHFGLYRL